MNIMNNRSVAENVLKIQSTAHPSLTFVITVATCGALVPKNSIKGHAV